MKDDVTKKPAGRPKKNIDKTPVPSVDSSHQGANQTPTNTRRKRIPVQGGNRLELPKRPGFVRRWVHEDSRIDPEKSGRIQKFLDAWWTFITEKGLYTGAERASDSSQMDSRVTKDGGGGITLYAMEIPQEYYDEDQAAKMEQVDRLERDIKSRLQNETGDSSYGKVSISHGISRIPKGGGQRNNDD